MSIRLKHRSVHRVEDITVYPEFVMFMRKDNLLPVAPVCEDDDGSICFLSQIDKDRYIGGLSEKRLCPLDNK